MNITEQQNEIVSYFENIINKIQRKEYTHTEMRDLLVYCHIVENRINNIKNKIEYYKNGEDLK